MKKYRITAAVLLTFLILAGCGRRINYSLPAEPLEFELGTFSNPADKDDTYGSIEYNGRTYILYGTLKGFIRKENVGECLGYIVQDGEKLEDERVFLLNDDPDANYLVCFFVNGFMDQPDFFRDVDTAGSDILTPSYIQSLEYDYWE